MLIRWKKEGKYQCLLNTLPWQVATTSDLAYSHHLDVKAVVAL